MSTIEEVVSRISDAQASLAEARDYIAEAAKEYEQMPEDSGRLELYCGRLFLGNKYLETAVHQIHDASSGTNKLLSLRPGSLPD